MNLMRRFYLLGVCALVWPSVLASGQSQASESKQVRVKQRRAHVDRTLIVLRQLDKVIPAVNFDEEPFEDVLKWFREQGLENVLVHWPKLEASGTIDASTTVTLRLRRMTLGELLDMVLEIVSHEAPNKSGRLFYRIRSGVVEISTREHFAEEIVTRTYDVEDLLTALPFHGDGPTVSVAAGAGGSSGSGGGPGETGGSFEGGGRAEQIDFEALREEQRDKLIELIEQIRPATWRDNGGEGTVAAFRGKLVISQTIEVHEIIGGMFQQM